MMRKALARQLRTAAFAVPEDVPLAQASTLPTTGEEKLMWKVQGNAFPGHDFAFNVPDPEDPITGQKVGYREVEFIGRAAEPAHQSDFHKRIFDVRRNPPIDFGPGAIRSNAHSNGNPWMFAGGALDPTLREGAITNGVNNQYANFICESTSGIIKSGGGDTSLEVDLTDKSNNTTRLLQVQISESAVAEGRAELPQIEGADWASETQAGRLESEVKYHLSTVGTAYHIEGNSGSSRGDEVRCQVCTDNPYHALFWSSLLAPLPGRDYHTLKNGSAPIKIFHAPGYQFESERVIEEFGGPKAADLGIEHNKFIVIDPHSKPATALIAGDISLEAARDTLSYLNGVLLFEELDTLTVPGDAEYADGSVTVYVGGKESIRDSPTLFGAHHLTLSADGVGKLWDATTHEKGSNSYPGSLNSTTDGKTFVTRTLLRRTNDPSSTRKSRSLHSDTRQTPTSVTYASSTPEQGLKLGQAFTPHTNTIPNSVSLSKTTLVFSDSAATASTKLTADDAGKRFVAAVRSSGYLYGSDEELLASFLRLTENGLSFKLSSGKTAAASPPKTASAASSTPEPAKTPASKAPKKKKK